MSAIWQMPRCGIDPLPTCSCCLRTDLEPRSMTGIGSLARSYLAETVAIEAVGVAEASDSHLSAFGMAEGTEVPKAARVVILSEDPQIAVGARDFRTPADGDTPNFTTTSRPTRSRPGTRR